MCLCVKSVFALQVCVFDYMLQHYLVLLSTMNFK